MASIDDYFNIDSKHNITVNSIRELTDADGRKLSIRMFQNLGVGASYFAVRLPQVENTLEYCLSMIHGNLVAVVMDALPKVAVSSERPKLHEVEAASLQYCGRIYIYSDVDLKQEEIDRIHGEGRRQGLFVEYFGPAWAQERSAMEKPLAFISHDSRDKDTIARPLALKLSGVGVPVWFDEFSLKIGDSLRESIERGLKETDYCILVLSKHFLSNDGWTKAEFNAIFSREIVEKEKLILPIWHDVSPKEVYAYSPTLVDRVAANWKEGVDVVADKIKGRLEG